MVGVIGTPDGLNGVHWREPIVKEERSFWRRKMDYFFGVVGCYVCVSVEICCWLVFRVVVVIVFDKDGLICE